LVRFALAAREHADEIANLRTAAGAALAKKHGPGHWAGISTDAGVMRDIRASQVLIVIGRGRIAGTLTLQKKKPWAIDPSFFTAVARPVYLINMAVLPRWQGKGVGRALLKEADRMAVEAGYGAIRLDAYEGPAGAGGFYKRCGYKAAGGKVYKGIPLLYFERVFHS
jgi:GNAT superfamily N-acetyltransferase